MEGQDNVGADLLRRRAAQRRARLLNRQDERIQQIQPGKAIPRNPLDEAEHRIERILESTSSSGTPFDAPCPFAPLSQGSFPPFRADRSLLPDDTNSANSFPAVGLQDPFRSQYPHRSQSSAPAQGARSAVFPRPPSPLSDRHRRQIVSLAALGCVVLSVLCSKSDWLRLPFYAPLHDGYYFTYLAPIFWRGYFTMEICLFFGSTQSDRLDPSTLLDAHLIVPLIGFGSLFLAGALRSIVPVACVVAGSGVVFNKYYLQRDLHRTWFGGFFPRFDPSSLFLYFQLFRRLLQDFAVFCAFTAIGVLLTFLGGKYILGI